MGIGAGLEGEEPRAGALRLAAMPLLADTTPLQTPDFRRIWLAGIPRVVGANLTIFAVPVQIYALTQNSAYVGLAGLFALVPLLVFGLLGGAWADAMDRRVLLILTSFGLPLASLLLFAQAAASLDDVWVVLWLLALQQGLSAINTPVRSAAIPRILPGGQLPAANTLNMAVAEFGSIAGPLLGGLMLKWGDFSTLYLLDALTCLPPIWANWRLPAMPSIPSPGPAGASRWGIGAIWDGFQYLTGNKVILTSFVVDVTAMIFAMPRALFPQIAYQDFGGPIDGGTEIALLAAAMSVGAVAGGIFSGWLPRIRRQGLTIVIATIAWGLSIVGFGTVVGFADREPAWMLWAALAFLAFGGAADMVAAAFGQTIVQQVTSDDRVGRLQGVFAVVVGSGPRAADPVQGGAAALIGPGATAVGGGLLVVAGMLVVAVAVPSFIRYRAPNGDAEP